MLSAALKFNGLTPFLNFNVTLPVQNIKPLTLMPNVILMESATEQPLSLLILVHLCLGSWDIVIQPAEGKIVLMRDVLAGIYTSLQELATQADYEWLLPAQQCEAAAAYSHHWK
ncbi:hypothetical protein DFH08DRAFT_691344 [Mycena albidolilacea]|uniref:DUF6699 domain-containing protein n=1 Tax=Mycena albidolilacea TaxID=1033008 RepID=A0AAD7ABN8_9AGAR|nr:hypothetical protein DFH08DRAFT_691344 [Mycena albidolilacea]